MPRISITAKVACLRREIAMRKRVYPKWVDQGRMHQVDAEREIAVIQAILDDYTAVHQPGLFDEAEEPGDAHL